MISNTNVHFVPWGSGHVDQHAVLGSEWLMKQPGHRAVFVPTKKSFEGNGILPRLLPGVAVVTGRAQRNRSWNGGPLLVCWPTEKMLVMLVGDLGRQVTSVCVLDRGVNPSVRTLLTVYRAVDLTTGVPITARAELPPMVDEGRFGAV